MPEKVFLFRGIVILALIAATTAGVFMPATGAIAAEPDYKNPSLSIERRVNDLIGRMTLEEKVAQLYNFNPYSLSLEGKSVEDVISADGVGGVTRIDVFSGNIATTARESAEAVNSIQRLIVEKTRLGIPAIIHNEALHGLTATGATSFPQAIGLAATFDVDMMNRVAHAIAVETRESGFRQVLSPVVNIARDVRWGRTQETYGEDPYLSSRMGATYCKAFTDLGVITTPKHFVANFGDGGRDSNAIHFSERLLREIYFPAYKACILEGGAMSLMPAFNSLNGRPCNANRWLLTDVLRNEWGFEGFTVCDYDALVEVITLHQTAKDKKEAAAQALTAGMDRELPASNVYGEALIAAVREGMVTESVVDTSVRRILTAKMRLGLFEDPYVDPAKADAGFNTPEHRELAREAARKAIVLLKNDNGVLPLGKNLKTIAVIGPDADVAKLGGYSGTGMEKVSILEGIRNKVASSVKIIHERGTDFTGYTYPAVPPECFFHKENGRTLPGLKVEFFNNMDLSGAPVVVKTDKNIDVDWGGGSPDPKVNHDGFSARWTGILTAPVNGTVTFSLTSGDGIRFYFDGKQIFSNWNDRLSTTDYFPIVLEKGRQYDIVVEFYENKWGATASLGWDIGFETAEAAKIKKAAEAAKTADVAIIVTGIIEGEFQDRADLDLPGYQNVLISAVAATGTPTVVLLVAGSAVTMNEWLADVKAVVDVWYPGEEGGNAVADVLFGDYNPAGRLPVSFPRSVSQLPLYYNYKPSGRGYDYIGLSAVPQYPFGYGLSYTTFAYGPLSFDKKTIGPDGSLTVSVDVTNTGTVRGDEVVQLYLHDSIASVSRPVKELKGFQRITLAPGEKKTVRFTIAPDALKILDESMKWVVEPGEFKVMIGASSEDIRTEGIFTVK